MYDSVRTWFGSTIPVLLPLEWAPAAAKAALILRIHTSASRTESAARRMGSWVEFSKREKTNKPFLSRCSSLTAPCSQQGQRRTTVSRNDAVQTRQSTRAREKWCVCNQSQMFALYKPRGSIDVSEMPAAREGANLIRVKKLGLAGILGFRLLLSVGVVHDKGRHVPVGPLFVHAAVVIQHVFQSMDGKPPLLPPAVCGVPVSNESKHLLAI